MLAAIASAAVRVRAIAKTLRRSWEDIVPLRLFQINKKKKTEKINKK